MRSPHRGGPARRSSSVVRRAGVMLAASVTALVSAGGDPVIGPPVLVDFGGDAASNETTGAASAVNPDVVIGGWNDWRDSGFNEIIRCAFTISFDGGATWSDFLLRPPAPNQTTVEGDPMTAFCDRTGALWAGGIAFSGNGGLFVARLDAGETDFEPPVMADTGGGIDKGWMAAGPRPGDPDSTRLYIAYNFGVIWSDDMGETWTNPTSLGGGVGFLPRVGPDGELYIAYWDGDDGVKMQRSLNGGASFQNITIATRMDVWGTQSGSRFPGTFRVPAINYLDVDQTTGDLYCVYFDTTNVVFGNSNVDLYFTKSTDQGDTWTDPVVINGDGFPRPGDQFFPWLEVDDDGGIHIVFLDSRNTVQDDDVVNAFFDAYYLYSADQGASWFEARLTPNSWNSENDGLDRPNQFMGDYLGMAVAGDRAYPFYPDTSDGDPDVYSHVIQIPGGEPDPDLDGDGVVGPADLAILLAAWGGDGPADLNGDGEVGPEDLAILLAAWDD